MDKKSIEILGYMLISLFSTNSVSKKKNTQNGSFLASVVLGLYAKEAETMTTEAPTFESTC